MRQSLRTEIQNAGIKSESTRKRLWNINFIVNLDREDLIQGEREKQILIKSTDLGEHVYIQYPGKESTNEKNPRPWDFRPKVFVVRHNQNIDDLGFSDIWDILFETLAHVDEMNSRALATTFYRMAYMLDHYIDETSAESYTTTRYISITNSGREGVAEAKEEALPQWYRYVPPDSVLTDLNELDEAIKDFAGIGLETFLQYNDLLAWNEDCKYFYRNQMEKDGEWIGPTGRVNTLLSHVSIIGLLLDEVRLSTLLGRFAQRRGVVPATRKESIAICGGLVI